MRSKQKVFRQSLAFILVWTTLVLCATSTSTAWLPAAFTLGGSLIG
jgi:hypothetical protein